MLIPGMICSDVGQTPRLLERGRTTHSGEQPLELVDVPLQILDMTASNGLSRSH